MRVNWDAIGTVSEAVGAIAVVISLIYVAAQIQQNTKATQLTTAQNVTQDLREVLSYLHADEEFARIFLQAQADVGSLTPVEKFRVYVFLADSLRAHENIYYQYKNGAVEEYVWTSTVAQLRLSAGTSSHTAFWSDRKHIFSQEFQSFYDSLVAGDPNLAIEPYGDVDSLSDTSE